MIRKNISTMMMVAAFSLLLFSCNDEPITLIPDDALELVGETFVGNGTKAAVSQNVSNWVNGESIRINNESKDIVVTSAGAYIEHVVEAANYVAVYPTSVLDDEDADLTGGATVTINVPSVFNYQKSGGLQVLDVPMYSTGVDNGGRLYFRHLTAAITVMLTNATAYPLIVDSIIVSNSMYQLSGSKSVTLTPGQEATIPAAAKSGDNNKVVVLGNGLLTIPANTTGQANAVDVQVPILPVGGENSAFTIRVRTHYEGTVGGVVFQQTQDGGDKSIARGQIGYAMAKMDAYGQDNMTYIGLFTINDSEDKVFFSMGNLQYQASTSTWRFAENQYDYVGDASYGNVYVGAVKSNNANIADDYTGWIDLFGCGTGSTPTKHTTSGSDYSPYVDWGTSASSYIGSDWRAMSSGSSSEWEYIYLTRSTTTNNLPTGTGSNTSARFVMAKIANTYKGIILFPDTYTHPNDVTIGGTIVYNAKSDFTATISSIDDWSKMEAAGAVFLPAAGQRYSTTVSNTLSNGYYWGGDASNCFQFAKAGVSCSYTGKYYGCSVRLVRNVN